MQEERFWIAQIKKGRMDAFNLLYQKHYRTLYNLCRNYTNTKEDAEEQMQEIFMRILEKIDSFRGDAKFSTWAYRLAVNHLLNHVRSRPANRETELEVVPEQAESQSDPAAVLAVRKAVSELPEGFRNVLVLHDQEGLKHAEIASILGITESTSRSQLMRARAALREVLKNPFNPQPAT